MSNGAQTLTITTTDLAGNTSSNEIAVNVNLGEEDTTAPVITADLTTDSGISESDRITNNPAVNGSVTDSSQITSFRAGFNDSATENFVDVLDDLQPDGSFSFDAAKLREINGDVDLSEGEHTLKLIASDTVGNVSEVFNFVFTLDTQLPTFTVNNPSAREILSSGARLIGTSDGTGSGIANLIYQFSGGAQVAVPVNDNGEFDVELDFTGISDGANTLTITTVDLAGNVSSNSIAVTLNTVSLETLSVTLGERLEVDLTEIIANSENASFFIESDEELPGGLLTGDGKLVFNPTPDEVGTYAFTVVVRTEDTETKQNFSVQVVADTINTTRLSGVVENTDEEPLAGVVISIGDLTTTTGDDGSFVLELSADIAGDDFIRIEPGQEVGGEVYPSVAEKISLLLERDPFTGVNNVIDRPIFLPPIDMTNAVTIDPTVDTTVTTEAIPGAGVFVAAGTLENQEGEAFTGQLSITDVPRELTPAALPPNLLPDALVTIQPGEMVFNQPAPLSMPNLAGYAPGTEMDLWSINPVTGEFDNVGTGRVSADGSVIETIDGGIRNSSWHFFSPPPETPTDPDENPRNPDDGCNDCKATAAGTSEVELHSGAVLENHNLVSYQSLGVNRGLTLNYDSLRADPRPIVNFGYANAQANPNRRLIAELTVNRGDFELQVPGFAGGEFGLNGGEHFWSLPDDGGAIDAALQVDLRSFSSGRYNYELTTGLVQFNNDLFSGTTSTSTGQLLHINTIDSPFGHGWGLAGLHELIENPDGSVILVDGDGSELLFEPPLNPGDAYESPAADFSTLERLEDGTFRRTLTDQTVYIFNAQNKLELMRDRNGNESQFTYNEAGNITKFIDPVGLETTFTYTNGKVTSITDPSQRVTQLEYDSAGNLTRITDPDGSQRTWEYDADRHMVAEIDKRGNREETFYDFAGRADRAVRKDGSELDFDPVQVQGLYTPDRTINPLNAPVAFQLGAVESTYVDGNGNTIVNTLDQAGQIVSSTDEVGALPTVERNEDNLITRSTDAIGNISLFNYDDKGNVLTIEDGIASNGNVVSGSISEPGEVDEFTFEGIAGQQLYYDNLIDDSNNSVNLSAQLLSPSGESIFNVTANRDSQLSILTETGTYRLVLDGGVGQTGDYNFQLLDAANATILTPGTIVTESLDPGVETDIYQFEGTAGQRVLFDSINDGGLFGNSWILYGPGNQQLSNLTLGIDFETTLSTDGTYVLVVDGNTNGGTIDYSFRLTDSSDDPIDVSGLGSLISGEIAEGEQDTFTFTAPAGLPIYFDSQDGDNDPIRVEIDDPTGTRLFFNDASFDRGIVTLNRSGTYTGTVRGDFSSATGDYNFKLINLQTDAAELALGTTIAENIGGFEVDIYRFTGTTGQKIYFDSLVNQFQDVDIRLVNPSGNNIFNINSDRNSGVLSLSEAGTYYLIVENDGEAAADYSFRLLDTANATGLTLDTVITGTLEPGIETDIYQFEGTADQKLFFDSLGAASGRWLLYGPGNQFIRSRNLNTDFEQTLTSNGTYLLVIEGSNTSGTVDYNFQVVTPQTTNTALTLGETVTGSISELGEIDEYTFEGIGKRIYFDAIGTDANVNVELVSPNGNRIFSTNSDDDRGVFALTEAGTYRLIVNGDFGETGDYSFRLFDTVEAPVLTLDTPVTGSLDPGNSSNIYQFEGTADQKLFFNSLGTASGRWLLYGPGNQLIESRSLSSDFEEILTADGTYLLVIQGNTTNGTVNYNFQVVTPQTTIAALTLGETVTGTISEPGEVDEYTFEGVGKRIYFDAIGTDANVNAELISPNGNRIFFTNSDDDRGTFTLTEVGTYRLLLNGDFGDTGNYNFRLLDIETIPSLTLDTTVTGNLDPGLETDLYKFEGTAGEKLFFEQLSTPAGGRWVLYGVGDQSLSDRSLGSNFEATLLADGTYVLALQGNITSGTISYSFQVLNPETTITELTLGETVTGNISEPGEVDEYTFAATPGQRIYFDALGFDSDIDAQLLSPSGVSIFNIFSDDDRGPLTLTEAGTYRLVVDSGFGDTGNYSFRLLDVATASTLTVGSTITGSLDPGIETDIYQFEGTAGQRLNFEQLLNPSEASWYLYGPGNESIVSRNINSDFDNTLLRDGTYLLVLEGNASSGTINYSFQVTDISDATVEVTGLGTLLSGEIAAGEEDTFTFTAPAGLPIYFDSQDGDNDPISLEIVDPDGTRVFSRDASFDRGPVILTRSGTYTVTVKGDSASATGDYNFRILDLQSAATDLVLGTTTTETLSAFKTDIYRFNGTPGQKLYLDSLVGQFQNVDIQLVSPNGSSVFNITSERDQAPFTLSEPGTYYLIVENNTDAAADFSFRLVDLLNATALTLDTVTNGTLDPGIETDLYQFTGTANQKLFFDSLATANGTWLLYGPRNQLIRSRSLSSDFEETLPTDGSYVLLIDGNTTNGTVDYSFQITTPESTTTALTLGETVTGSVTELGEADEFTFIGAIGQRLYFDALGIDASVNAQLFSPSGNSIFFNNSNNDRQPFTLTEAGTYRLVLNGDFAESGDYSFRLLDITEATTLTLDTVTSGTLDPGLSSQLYKFEGTAEQVLFFDSLDFNQSWLVYGPGNQLIDSDRFGRDFKVTLPTDGTYVLVLDGETSDGTVDYSFQVVTPSTTTTALTLGETITGSISEPGEVDEFTFTGEIGQKLYFDALGADFNVDVQLFSPSGVSVFNIFSDDDREPFTLTEAGTYRLVVDGGFNDTGDYSFRLLDTADVPTLTLDTVISGSLNPGKESDIYKFEGTAEQVLYFDNLGTFNQRWQLYGPGGQLVNSGFGRDFEATLPTDGTYFLVLDGEITDGTIDYSFQVVTPQRTTTALNLAAVGIGERQFTYDPIFNQLTSTTDELGRQTLFEIDSNNGNLLSTTQVIGEVGDDDDIVTQFTYTDQGLLDIITDPLGRITDFDYNDLGLLSLITFAKDTADEATQQFEYDTAGNQTAVIDENGNRTEFEYDALNRLVKITEADPDGDGPLTAPVSTFTYDQAGNLLTITDALGNLTQNQYDVLERLTQTVDALENTSSYGYDSLGNLTSIIDPLGNETKNIYDQRNRLIETIDPDEGSTKFSYDFDNNLTSVIDPVENETTFTYDARNRLISETDPLGNTMTFNYDAVDNLISQTDRNNRVTEFDYDDIDRLITENWVGDEQVINYNYDKASNLTSVTDKFSSLAYTYDNRDRVLSVDNAGTPNAPNVVLNYSYDGVGNVLSVADTINGVASGTNSYSYDALNRLTQLTQSGNGVSDKRVDFGYNAIGQFNTINRYSDLGGTQLVTGTNYSYDALNRLSNLTHNNGTADIAFYNFGYNADSLITQITDIDGVTDYTYDSRDQLIGADHSDDNNPDESYTYDANGNRISSSIHGEGYVTGDGNRLLSDGTYNYEYDNEGNLIRRTEIATGAVRELEWDYRNRLVAVIEKDAGGNETQRVEYTYDAFNRRISKAVDTNPQDAVGGEVTHFVYDGEDVLLEFVDEDGVSGANEPVLDKRYLHGPAVDQVLAQEDASGNVQWHLADHLGTIRDLVDNSGTVVNHLTYDSFGNVVAETNPAINTRYMFTGREFDQETGLHYYRARYYNSSTGRFLSEDPIGFEAEDFNTYRYVLNAPVIYTDPEGLIIPQLIGGAFGVASGYLLSGGCYDWKDALVDFGLGAIGGGFGATAGRKGLVSLTKGLSNKTKGKIGEALSDINNYVRGSRKIASQQKIPGQTTRVDSVWIGRNGNKYYVESKFGTSGLTKPQRAARKALPKDVYRVEKWNYDWVGNTGAKAGSALGGTAGGVLGNIGSGNDCDCK